jgi:hypothetical protein
MPLKVLALRSGFHESHANASDTRIPARMTVETLPLAMRGVYFLQTTVGAQDFRDDMLAALEAPIQRVLDACLAHQIPCGLHIGNLDWLVEWQRRGMQLLCYATDILFLQKGAAAGVARLREG